MLNNGTKYKALVQEMYPLTHCSKTAENVFKSRKPNGKMKNGYFETDSYGRYLFYEYVYVIYIHSSQPWNGQVIRIGAGKNPWMAWKNAFETTVSKKIVEKLES